MAEKEQHGQEGELNKWNTEVPKNYVKNRMARLRAIKAARAAAAKASGGTGEAQASTGTRAGAATLRKRKTKSRKSKSRKYRR